MRPWIWNVITAGATAALGMLALWALGVFQAGAAAIDDQHIKQIIAEETLDADDIRAILDEKLKTANGDTYGQVLVLTKDQVIVLRTKVEILERAMTEFTRSR